MTAIPSIRIEGVSSEGEKSPGAIFTGLVSSDYDSLIKTHPEARLQYLDEDEDKVIVGSSAELLDRLSELPSNLIPTFQTLTPLGLENWLSFFHETNSKPIDQPPSPTRTLFEGFQRDLEAALEATLFPNAAATINEPSTPQPHTVDSFLTTLTSTVSSTLSSVYPHTAQLTTNLRHNPALRQAAEVLQTVGHTARQSVHTPEERSRVAAEVATEIKAAVQTVGNVLGDLVQEVGNGYAAVGQEIGRDVQRLEVKKTISDVGKAVGTAGSVVGGVVKEVGQAYAIVGREIGRGVSNFVKTAVMAAGTAPVGLGSVRVELCPDCCPGCGSGQREAETATTNEPTTEKKTDTEKEQTASSETRQETSKDRSQPEQETTASEQASKPDVDPETEEALDSSIKGTLDKLWSASDAVLDAMLAAADGELSQEVTEVDGYEETPKEKQDSKA